jgi:hypothetical protein
MRTPWLLSALASGVLGTLACSATHVVRPLPRGTSQVSFSFGGPLLPDKVVTKVVPYASVGWQRGMTDALTMGGSLHATMAAFGVAGGELSATHRLLGERDDALALVGTAHGYLFAGRGGTRVYPAAGLVGSWRPGERALFYGGGTAIGQFNGTPSVVLTPLLGAQRSLGRRLALQAEVKWMAANTDTRAGVFEGESSIGGRGAMAVQLGALWRRGGAR